MSVRQKLIPFKKSNPCPGCAGYSQTGCKRNPEYTWVLCRKVSRASEVPDGWVWRGLSKDGGWGQLARADERGEVIPFRPRQQIEQPSKHLSITERAIQYKKLINQLKLDDQHADWLALKGLPREAAERYGFVSYAPQTRFEGLSALLPGVHPEDPTRLLPATNAGGLLLPMLDKDGFPLGFQRVLPGRIKAELAGEAWEAPAGFGKYNWLTSTSYKKGPVPVLQLPEPYAHIPLGFYTPENLNPDYADAQILAEGPLKSAIASWNAGLRVLSTPSGGRFTDGDGRLYKQVLDVIESQKANRIILAADAGMVSNKDVARAYYQLFKALEAIDIQLLVMWWGQTTKQEPDIDDLIVSGGFDRVQIISYQSYFIKQDAFIQRKLDKKLACGFNLKVIRSAAVAKADAIDVNQAREELRKTAESVLLNGNPGQLTVLQHGTGLGKSTTVAKVAMELVSRKILKGRTLFLVKTKALAQQLMEILGSKGYLMEGRTPEPNTPFTCGAYTTYSPIANARHNAVEAFCLDCREYKRCPFIETQEFSKRAPIVVATYKAYINESQKLKEFDRVICDETLYEELAETLVFTRNMLDDYQKSIAEYHSDFYSEGDPIFTVFEALQELLNHCTMLTQHKAMDAGEAWASVYQANQLHDVLSREPGLDEDAAYQTKTFQFENARRLPNGRMIVRMMADLLDALTDGRGRAKLTSEGIKFSKPFSALALLKLMHVISLDATPALDLLSDIWGAEQVTVCGQGGIASNVHVTQILGPLYTREGLKRNPSLLRDLETLAAHCLEGAKTPFIAGHKEFMPKAWRQEDITPDFEKILNIDHLCGENQAWFRADTRGSNAFIECDQVFIAGYHQRPMLETELIVNALRMSAPVSTETDRLPQAADLVGNSAMVPARLQIVHLDPLVQSVVDNERSGEIIQTIGRLRPLTKNGIVRAYIASGAALAGIPIDETIEAQAIIDPTGSRKKRAHIEKRNQDASEIARNKVEAFLAENPKASVRKIMDGTGLASATVQRHLKAIREQMGTVSPIAILNNKTMTDTPPIQTVSQFSGFAEELGEDTGDLEETCITADGVVYTTFNDIEWHDGTLSESLVVGECLLSEDAAPPGLTLVNPNST